MNPVHILLRCITLLFRESQLKNSYSNSQGLVLEILEVVLPPAVNVGIVDTQREIIVGLRNILKTMVSQSDNRQYIMTDLLQKVRSLTVHDDKLYVLLKEGIEPELKDDEALTFCLSIRTDLGHYIRDLKAIKLVNEANKEMRKFSNDTSIDITDITAKLINELEPYAQRKKEKDPAIVGQISITDIEKSMLEFDTARDLNTDEGILRTGWQGLNRMLQGGIRRGYECVIGALQHNYKTGFTKQLFIQLARYNKPYMLDPSKKPLLLSISFEDSLALNLPFVFKILWENIYDEPAPLDRDSRFMAEFINKELSVNGYEVVFMHVNPSLWTYRDIQNIVLEYESKGYEIHALLLDYLALVPTTGCNTHGPTGSDIRDMYRRLRNFVSSKKIALITPHQLSTEAKMLVRNGLEETFVQEIANKGYYDGCRTIDQEVDLEIYIHIVIFNSKSWLTIQRGKHRLTVVTPEEHKYIVLPFEEIGNLREDIGKSETTRKKVGGNPIHSNEEKPFYDF